MARAKPMVTLTCEHCKREFRLQQGHYASRADNRPENLELWSSSQPPGQRVSDKLDFAADLLRQYSVIGAPATLSEAVAGLAGIG